MNKGALRGLGLPGGIAPLPNLWVGGNPLTDIKIGEALELPRGTNPIPIYFKNTVRTPDLPGQNSVFIGIDDSRNVQNNPAASSSEPAGNSATLKIYVNPNLSSSLTDYSHTGISVTSAIGLDSVGGAAGLPSLASGRFAAVACHYDSVLPSIFGLYGFVAHIGLVPSSGTVATEAVAFDVNAVNSFGSHATNSYGYRAVTGSVGSGLTNWGLMIGNMQSQIRGQITLGGAADNTSPAAQADIQNINAPVSGGTSPSAVLSLTDTPGSGSAIVRRTFRGYVTTTNATSATITGNASLTFPGRYFIRGVIMARQTGGSAGTTGQGAAWTFTIGFKDGTIDGAFAATLIGTLPTGWAAPVAFTAYGGWGITIQGAANENVTWHCEMDVYGPLVS